MVAFVSSADLGNNSGGTNSLTAAFTVASGSNRLLVVTVVGDGFGGFDDLTSATFNGVSMGTPLKGSPDVSGERFIYTYYLLAPTVGTFNVVVNCSNNHYLLAVAAQYTGVAATGQPDATNTVNFTAPGSQVDVPITIVTNNSWATLGVSPVNSSSLTWSSGTNATLRTQGAAFNLPVYFDSNAGLAPGSQTLTGGVSTGIDNAVTNAVSFSPGVAGTTWAGAASFAGAGHLTELDGVVRRTAASFSGTGSLGAATLPPNSVVFDTVSAIEGGSKAANYGLFTRFIRRRTPAGITRRIFFPGGPARQTMESQAAVLVDATAVAETPFAQLLRARFAAIEGLKGSSSDALAKAEAQAIRSVDALASTEATKNLSRDFNALAEGRAVVVPDAWVSAEELTGARSDSATAVEQTRLAQRDVNALLELLGNASAIFDARGVIEHATTRQIEALAILENISSTSSMTSDGIAAIESLGRSIADALALVEFAGVVLADRFAFLESSGLILLRADAAGLVEVRRTTAGDAFAGVDVRALARGDAAALSEVLGGGTLTASGMGLLELLRIGRGDAIGAGESLTTPIYPNRTTTEYAGNIGRDILAALESVRSIGFSSDAAAAVEALAKAEGRGSGPIEALILKILESYAAIGHYGVFVVSVDTNPLIESLALSATGSDVFGATEISGQTISLPDIIAILENVIAVGSDPTVEGAAQIENIGILGARAATLIDGGYLVLDKTHTSVSIGRVRTVIAPFTTLGVTVQPFDPFAAGMVDTFVCDFTPDVGFAGIASTIWRVSFDSGNTEAYDDTPQARAITAWTPTTIYVANPLDGTLQQLDGAFSAAVIGALPVSAIGGVYTLTIIANLTDTRVIEVSSSFLCVARQAS